MDESEGEDRKTMSSHAYPAAAARRGRRSGQVGDDVQAHIGDRLAKTIYDRVLNEPVPERFLDLLSQLERSEREPGRGSR